MLSFQNVKSKWYSVILFAAVVNLAIIYQQSSYIENDDARFAIKRAKTSSCKIELHNFARRISTDLLSHVQLKRSCRLDLNKIRNQRIGCISNSTNGLVKLDNKLLNASVCLEYCFSYGHSHGGYHVPTNNCFCGYNAQVIHQSSSEDCSDHDNFDWYQVNNGIYSPTNAINSNYTTGRRQSKKIRIAFLLILNGRSDQQIRRLLKNLYCRDHLYYLHVDKRNYYLFNRLISLAEEHSNVIVTKSRFNTIWGGPSLLRMIVDALEHLLQYNWDYLINLSESDLPIKPLEMIESHLLQNNPAIFLKTHNIKGYNFIKKQGLDYDFYQCEDRVWRMGKRRLPRGIIWSGGSDWFALPKDFCTYILDNLTNSKDLVKPLMQIYNHTLLPAESFFHTLALNSDFCDRIIDNNLRLTNWNRKKGCKCQHKDVVDWCGCSPLVYRSSDWEKLKRTNQSKDLMFSRKFDPTISSSIIALVEDQLVAASRLLPGDIEYDTRFWQNIFSSNKSIDMPDPTHKVWHQFGQYILHQVYQETAPRSSNHSELRSMDAFFNKDRFIGWVVKFCSSETCMKVLVEKNEDAHLQSYNDRCFRSNDRRNLKVIEVNHGFDTSERMFRIHKPMYHKSEVVVYHEWSVNKPKNVSIDDLNQLKFEWFSPEKQLELAQTIKLKRVFQPTRLTLVHRLNIQKPIMSGLWTLKITYRSKHCLDYKFLIFDDTTYEQKSISQQEFNKFYNVTKKCILPPFNHDENESNLCSKQDWTNH